MTLAKDSTIVVELTPRGRAAVAVVLIEGPDAVRVVDGCFQPASGRAMADTAIGRIAFGWWRAGSSARLSSPQASTPATAGEEVIACRRSDDRLEIHCHGGTAAVGAVMDRLCECGCQAVPCQKWIEKTELDPIRAAAQIALASAPTARTAAVLLDQWHGALGDTIGSAWAATRRGDLRAAAELLNEILRYRDVGLHLTAPWRVVLAGAPNVGKSSLKNALVGYQRAIVCDLPGTTRDVVTTVTAIDGWPVELADTAGLRDTADEVEAEGVARAEAMLAAADLVVLVDDAADLRRPNFFGERIPPGKPTIRVLNKVDLLSASERPDEGPWDLLVSALSGEGIESLIAVIGRRLVPAAPPAGVGVPFTIGQVECLSAAREAIERHDVVGCGKCLQELVGN